MADLDLSIVIPLFNEEDSVPPLYAAVKSAVDDLGVRYEIIFVDDGSNDETLNRARLLAQGDLTLRVLSFRKNCGQTPAMAAGIDHARGAKIVTMDGDLQNDPKDIGMLIGKLEEGYDLAVGWRQKRQDKALTRKLPSKIANWIIGKITGVPIRDNGCSLKAYRADVIKQIPLYSDMHRFIPAMASISGAKIVEVPVRHHARQHGVSKYGLNRTFKVLVDLLSVKTIISFSHRPLLWFALLAVPAVLIGIACLAHTFWTLLFEAHRVSLSIAGTGVLFAALGIFLALNGILAEMVFKTGDIRFAPLAKLTMEEK